MNKMLTDGRFLMHLKQASQLSITNTATCKVMKVNDMHVQMNTRTYKGKCSHQQRHILHSNKQEKNINIPFYSASKNLRNV